MWPPREAEGARRKRPRHLRCVTARDKRALSERPCPGAPLPREAHPGPLPSCPLTRRERITFDHPLLGPQWQPETRGRMAPPGSAGAQQAQPHRLQSPARRPPSILEVSNASPDDTREYLDPLAGHEPHMRPRRLAHNRGQPRVSSGAEPWRDRPGMNGSDSWTTMGCPCPRALRACSTTPKSPAPRSLSPPKLYTDGLIYNFAYKISRRTLRRRCRVLWDPPPHGAPRQGNPGHFEGASLHRTWARTSACLTDTSSSLGATPIMGCARPGIYNARMSRPVPPKAGGYGKAGSWGQGPPGRHAFFALAFSPQLPGSHAQPRAWDDWFRPSRPPSTGPPHKTAS